VFFASFLYLQFGFVIFWQKNIIAKKALKIFNVFCYQVAGFHSGAVDDNVEVKLVANFRQTSHPPAAHNFATLKVIILPTYFDCGKTAL